MTHTAKQPYWQQGLFLQPHHFQYQEHALRLEMQALRKGISPLLWGCSSVELRRDALDELVVDVVSAAVTFQDGTRVSLPENATLTARSFKDIAHTVVPGEPLVIYLALRRLDLTGSNVAEISPDGRRAGLEGRYAAVHEGDEVENLFEPKDPATIGFLDYLVKIIWSSELADYAEYHCVPVAAIIPSNETFEYSTTFIPPVTGIGDSPALLNLLRDLQDALVSRSRILELYKIARPMRVEDFEGNYLRYLESLRTINLFTPLLQQVIESPFLHPWDAYASIRQLIGGLSTFTDRINALGLLSNGTALVPPYDHENLEYCFGELKRLTRELLNAIIVGEENVVELQRDKALFSAELPSEIFDARNMVCLLVKAQGETRQLLNSLLRHAKLGAVEQMETMVARALDGLPVEYMETPPPGMPVYPDGYIFKLERTGPVWDDIRHEGSICLYWDEAPEEAVAEIIISRK